MSKRTEDILESLSELLGDQDAQLELLQLSRQNLAATIVNRAATTMQKPDANLHYTLKLLDEAVFYAPESAAANFLRGRIHIALSFFDQARKDLKVVVSLRDEDLSPLAIAMLKEMDREGS